MAQGEYISINKLMPGTWFVYKGKLYELAGTKQGKHVAYPIMGTKVQLKIATLFSSTTEVGVLWSMEQFTLSESIQ